MSIWIFQLYEFSDFRMTISEIQNDYKTANQNVPSHEFPLLHIEFHSLLKKDSIPEKENRALNLVLVRDSPKRKIFSIF
ncbi:hypothetical protein DLM77_20105 [Leptospira yasudae]|uniref:Uncharacterized protein n=1 Tax=Leptospira yasudae TaxID=2202201 RepID=A0ABX9LY02_9LEPT|nr:hypothetical protein DLM77_20105 [Leptospira yasudae]